MDPQRKNGHLSLDISQRTIGQAQVDQTGGHLRRCNTAESPRKKVKEICRSNPLNTFIYSLYIYANM